MDVFEGLDVLQIVAIISTILLISLIDFVVLVRARLRSHHAIHEYTKSDLDYTILIPIFGNISYLRNVEFLKEYARHVVLCTTTKESPEFDSAINKVAAEYGFRIFRSHVLLASSVQKPNPWRLFTHTLHGSGELEKQESDQNAGIRFNKEIARDEIIRDSFAAIDTSYCIFLDGDTVAYEKLFKLVHLMRELNFDLASVRVLASKQETIMEKLQSVEYDLAMDARKIYPWLTSGACMVAKTSVIKDIMQHHSLFFSGGDIEIGKLAGILKYKVGHIRFELYTDVPSTFKAWFKQRMAWFGGGFRHAVVNLHRYAWRHPLFYFYTTILVYLLTPLRWYEVIKHPFILPLIIVLYWLLIFSFHWRTRHWFYFLFPFYALIQILILIPLGIFTYFRMAFSTNNIGLIRLRRGRVFAQPERQPLEPIQGEIRKERQFADIRVRV